MLTLPDELSGDDVFDAQPPDAFREVFGQAVRDPRTLIVPRNDETSSGTDQVVDESLHVCRDHSLGVCGVGAVLGGGLGRLAVATKAISTMCEQ